MVNVTLNHFARDPRVGPRAPATAWILASATTSGALTAADQQGARSSTTSRSNYSEVETPANGRQAARRRRLQAFYLTRRSDGAASHATRRAPLVSVVAVVVSNTRRIRTWDGSAPPAPDPGTLQVSVLDATLVNSNSSRDMLGAMESDPLHATGR